MRLAILVPLIALLISGCGSSGSSSSGSKTTPAVSSSELGPLPKLQLQRVFAGLSFENLTGLYQMPDGRFLAMEQPGRLQLFDNREDAKASVFVDISNKVDSDSSELGLLGLAFAPDFAQSGVFYLDYTADKPLRTVVARFTADAGHATASASSQVVLLEVGQPFENHNGGQLAFGPDGDLYIAFGDGGNANDPNGNGQNRNVLLGKILRIDVSGTSPGLAYRIPADNPFVGQSGARGEIWTWGMRNPWRFSFDPQTGQMSIGDVGQSTREEIDIGQKGANYGWNIMEGGACRGGGNCNSTGLALPIFDYPTKSPDCAITGGFVYHGSAIPALQGAYVFGDYCSGRVSALRYDGTKVTDQGLLTSSKLSLTSFAIDAQGEIYALDHAASGGIYKLVP